MKKLLLRKIPLMLLLWVSLIFVTPFNTAHAHVSAYDFFQQSTPLKVLLNQISSYYKVTLLYDESLVRNKTTSYRFNPASGNSIEKVMQDLLTSLNLKAQKVDDDNYVVVSSAPKKTTPQQQPKKDEPTVQTVDPATEKVIIPTTTTPERVVVTNPVRTASSNVIKGRVVNNQNEEPIPSATVLAKGLNIFTTTDAEGYFSIKVPVEARFITVSHVSFAAKEVLIDTRNSMLIKLIGKDNTNENVVVLGLFKRPKENFTGAATSVTGEELRQVNSVSVLDALKVFDPAIRIPDNALFGSDPNRLPNITLRGTNNFPQQTNSTVPTSGADFMANYSTNPNQPLFILDGAEVSLQKIYDLDMNRIANFTILKDAAATSVYGSRAANGVIVVDTKQPEAGKLRLNYSGMIQITGPDLTVYDLTDAAEKLEVERLAGLYSTYATGIRPDADAVLRQTYANRLAAVQKGVNTYWLSQPVRTGYGQRHSFYLEGGDNHFRYGIDFGYNKVTGVMKNSDRSTYSGAMNFSYRNKGLLIKNVLSVSFNNSRNSNYGSFADYAKQNPYWNPYDSNGNYVKILESVTNPIQPGSGSNTNYYNPLYNTTLNTVDKKGYTNIINQASVDWNIGKGFRLTGRMGITKQVDESDVFLPAQHTSFANITDITKKGSYTKGNSKFFSYDGNVQVEYNKKIGRHQLFNTTGFGISQTKSDFLSVYVEGFPNQRLSEIIFGNAYPVNTKPTGGSSVSRRVSGFSNFNYNYDNRYQADVSLSADGSSQFGINNKFAPFWSAGASWNIHKEKFAASYSKYINQFRIRTTIGTTGDSRFPPYMGITTYQYYTDQSIRGQLGATLVGFGNPNLKWQQTIKKNAGADISLFKSRVNLTVDLYQEITKSLILDISTAPSVGVSSYRENIGEQENKGYEFKVNAFIIRNTKQKITWSVFLNGTHNRNFIRSISNSLKKQNELNDKTDTTRPQFRYKEGESVNSIWAVRSLGIDPSNGREIYLDRFGNKTYVYSPLDKVVVGDAIAELRGNFGSSVTWKGFTLGMYFSYEFGGEIYNQTLADRVEDANLAYNVDRRVLLGRWKKPGDVTFFKGLVDENGRTIVSKTSVTSRFIQKNNFVNAESITLSYLFSDKLNKFLGVTNTRINFTVNDIQRWSSIEIERGTQYPFARNFTINISTQF